MPWSSDISTSSAADRGRLRRAALALAGVGAGIALGVYSGLHLLLPLAATALAWWVGARALRGARRLVLPAAAVQVGHLLWLTFGQVAAGVLSAGAIDLVILAIGVGWLVARPGLAPTVLLTLYQAWALVTNASALVAVPAGTLAHRALLVHVVWRLLALVLMWRAYARSGRAGAANASA